MWRLEGESCWALQQWEWMRGQCVAVLSEFLCLEEKVKTWVPGEAGIVCFVRVASPFLMAGTFNWQPAAQEETTRSPG